MRHVLFAIAVMSLAVTACGTKHDQPALQGQSSGQIDAKLTSSIVLSARVNLRSAVPIGPRLYSLGARPGVGAFASSIEKPFSHSGPRPRRRS